MGIAIPSTPCTTHASPPDASRGFGVESGRFHAEGAQTFTVLERWAFLSYFAFGENDAYVIFDVPDNSTAAAISLAVAGTGVIRMKTIVLLTPEEMDQAMKKPVHYEA